MKTAELTTADVLKLEGECEIVTNATLPSGVMPNDSLRVWGEKMPLVAWSLLARWYKLRQAKVELQVELDKLTKVN